MMKVIIFVFIDLIFKYKNNNHQRTFHYHKIVKKMTIYTKIEIYGLHNAV